jgi:hypothetical protein
MRSNGFVVVFAAAVGLATVAQAQTMVEYSTLSTHSGQALAAPTSSAHTSRHHADPYGTTKGNVWQEKNARAKDAAPSKPTPPAVFILSNGERLESTAYVMTSDSLRVNQHGSQRTIPMSALNRNATMAANRERGVNLELPANKAQITLSF